MNKEEIVSRIISVLEDVNDEVVTYDGEDIVEDGIVDSLELVAIINGLEDEFNIEIDASYISEGKFANKDSIIEFICSELEV